MDESLNVTSKDRLKSLERKQTHIIKNLNKSINYLDKLKRKHFEQHVKEQLKSVLNKLELNKLKQEIKYKEDVDEELTSDSDSNDDTIEEDEEDEDEDEIRLNRKKSYLNKNSIESLNTSQQLTSKLNTYNANKTSKWYWKMNNIHLGSEWDRIQLKMSNLKIKLNETNEYRKKLLKNKSKIIIEINNELTPATASSRTIACNNLLNKKIIKFDYLKIKHSNAYNYFNNYLFKKLCSCLHNETCILCVASKTNSTLRINTLAPLNENIPRLDVILMDHSYSKYYFNKKLLNNEQECQEHKLVNLSDLPLTKNNSQQSFDSCDYSCHSFSNQSYKSLFNLLDNNELDETILSSSQTSNNHHHLIYNELRNDNDDLFSDLITNNDLLNKRKHNLKRKLNDFNLRNKRRSLSTCSSSTITNNETTQIQTSTTKRHNYMIINEYQNKFNIDNIVIPYDMLISKVSLPPKSLDIPTPKWRQLAHNQQNQLQINKYDLNYEDTDDVSYLRRHELCELKEKYNLIYKKKIEKDKKLKLKNNQQQQQQQQQEQSHDINNNNNNTSGLITPCESSLQQSDDLCLEEFKILVKKFEDEHVNSNSRRKSSLVI
jgi:hypothetical protein